MLLNYYWNALHKRLVIIKYWCIIMLSIFLIANIVKRLSYSFMDASVLDELCHVQPLSYSVTPLHSHWVLCFSWTSASILLPQGLCTCCYPCSEISLAFCRTLLKCYHTILNPPHNGHCSFLALLALVFITLISTQLLNYYHY